jgi:flavin reductase (DIM6/NTAB) family NADH-FMN oxidoreductase RutF
MPNSVIDSAQLRKAFGSYLTGVTVVTACTEEGGMVGFTANSFTSVSLEPPLLLVCPAKGLNCADVFNKCERFVINILAENQQEVSTVFAQNIENRFDKVNWHNDAWGVPIIEGAVTHFSCRTFKRIDAGDHIILVGEIVDFKTQGGAGLGYANGGYFTQNVNLDTFALAQASNTLQVGGIINYENQILVNFCDGKSSLPCFSCQSLERAPGILQKSLNDAGIEVSLLQIYSIFQDIKGRYFVYYRCIASNDNQGDLGEYLELSDLEVSSFQNYPLRSMIGRYIAEKQKEDFGIYIGGDLEGKTYI